MLLDEEPRFRGDQISAVGRVVGVAVVIGVVASIAISSVALNRALLAEQAASRGTTLNNITRAIAFRLLPNEDLLHGVMRVVLARRLKSAWIQSCVGSLTQFAIRFANQPNVSFGSGHFEIVSLVGTMTAVGGANGAHHLHISLGDGSGTTVSGHLAAGSLIYTTAEIVVGSCCDFLFQRGVDGSTPWDELQVVSTQWCAD